MDGHAIVAEGFASVPGGVGLKFRGGISFVADKTGDAGVATTLVRPRLESAYAHIVKLS
jgi:hypothetical protein